MRYLCLFQLSYTGWLGSLCFSSLSWSIPGLNLGKNLGENLVECETVLCIFWGVLLAVNQSGFVQPVHYTTTHGDLRVAHQLGAMAIGSLASQLSKCFQSTQYLVWRRQARKSLQRRQRAIPVYCDPSKSNCIETLCH